MLCCGASKRVRQSHAPGMVGRLTINVIQIRIGASIDQFPHVRQPTLRFRAYGH